jgi:DNA-binding transcriptional LysR family regulator
VKITEPPPCFCISAIWCLAPRKALVRLVAGDLNVIDLGVQPEAKWIYLGHAEGRQPSAKLRALADHLKQAFGDPPYWEIDKKR